MNKESNPVITVRLGEDLQKDLAEYIRKIGTGDNEQTSKISAIVRDALREYLQDHDLEEKGDLIKIRVEHGKYINEDVREVMYTFPDTLGINRSMDYIYLTLARFLFFM